MADEQQTSTTTETETTEVAEAASDKTSDASTEPEHWSRTEGFGFDDDTIGWLENKGFDNPQAAITSQRELERKMGGPPEMLQKWPESDDAEGFKAIYRRLGTPEDVEGYKVEFEEGTPIDADTLTWLKETALKHNMTNAMTQGIALDWNAEVTRLQTEQQEALDIQDKTEETELRTLWGVKYDERLDYGNRALKALGLEEENINSLQEALGSKKLALMAVKMADTMGEDTIAENTTTPAFGTSKEQVKNQIKELADELGADKKRYDIFLADHDAHKESTGKDFRKMKQLENQLEGLIKAET